jgi:hypothetical protein
LLHHSIRVSIKNFSARQGLPVKKGDAPLVQVGLQVLVCCLRSSRIFMQALMAVSCPLMFAVQLVGAAGIEDIVWQKQEDVSTVGSAGFDDPLVLRVAMAKLR